MTRTLSTPTYQYDLVILGSGAAGIHASVQAAKLGKKVAIVEKSGGQLGGAWIHTGTIPSKTLRETLAAIQSLKSHCGEEWVNRLVQDLSASKLLGRAKQVAQQEESVVREYITRNQIALLNGHGRILDPNHIEIQNNGQDCFKISTSHIIIATGSRPRRPSHLPFDGWRVIDSDDILCIPTKPRSMLIYGAGVIGCEYASIFNALGVKVTLVDSRSVMMQNLDRETTNELKKIMMNSGVKVLLGKDLKSVTCDGPKAIVHFGDGESLTTDMLFFAAGRVPSTANLGLEQLNIPLTERGAIVVNQHYQTCVENIYAVGDVIGLPALAATSAEQGRYASCHAFSDRQRSFPTNFPVGIYTIPEMSSVGATEEELISQRVDYVVGRAHFSEVARGYIRGDTEGLLKLLIDSKTHKILGIHIVGPDACNLIHIGLGFMIYDGAIQDIIDKMIFNYPTLAETFRIAAFNALNKIFTNGIIGDPPQKRDSQAS